ncbi:hypothetical protein [uncultured Pontibacter sp.]|uniref:hypothetical protein n=1 Tax=uncultured Pontibacter sp. TaxID=453356 RepID=UPI002614CC81|nr:hypothetical protein [uncultured Pontibacter sp.]
MKRLPLHDGPAQAAALYLTTKVYAESCAYAHFPFYFYSAFIWKVYNISGMAIISLPDGSAL